MYTRPVQMPGNPAQIGVVRRAIERGEMDAENNPLKRAPHTVEDLTPWSCTVDEVARAFAPARSFKQVSK